MPALPSWLIDPLWDQFAVLLPERAAYHPAHPLRCHRPRVADRVVFDKLVQVLVFGCGYRRIEDATCSATTLRDRRDEWIALGIFDELELLVLHAYDRMIGLELGDLTVDGCITKAPCGGEVAGPSPVDRGMAGQNATRGRPAPLQVGRRWVIERSHAWLNTFGKLRWCTERRQACAAFHLTLACVVVIIRRLIRQAWTHYRWPKRPSRCT